MVKNLYHLAGWITLLDGIKRIDDQCDRRGLDFDDFLKPEELEKYVVARKEDVLFSLRQMAKDQNVTEKKLLNTLVNRPISQLVDNICEYNAAHSIH